MTERPMLTIEDLQTTFQQNTTLKAVCLIRDRFSKNITLSAQVEDVLAATQSLPNRMLVSLITAQADGLKMSAEFDIEKNFGLKEQLLELAKLDFIKVTGTISSTAKNVLNLMDCNFERIGGYEF